MANFNVVDTSDVLQVGSTNLIPFVGHELVMYDRASVPLQTMMMKLGRVKNTPNPSYFWYEGQYDDPSTTCTGIANAAANAGQTITLNTLNVRVGDRYLEPINDQILVVTGNITYGASTTTADIKRYPTSEATIAVTGTPLLIRMDNMMLEGDYYPSPLTNLPAKSTNGISLISDAIAVSNIMNDTPSYYNQGNEFDFQRTAAIERFRKHIERDIIWSQYYQASVTQDHNGSGNWTNQAYSTNGIISSISTDNVIPYAGSITESGLDGFLEGTVWGNMYYGSDYKIGFCGPKVLTNIMSFAKNRTITPTGVPNMKYGINVTSYIGYGGQMLYLILEREFMETNPTYASSLVVLDPQHLQLMYHGTALMMVKNTTPPNQAIMSIGLESRPGMLLDSPQFHAIYQKG